MDKKIIIGILGIILLLGVIVIAPLVVNTEREISKELRDVAVEKGIDTYDRTDSFTNDKHYRNLISRGDFKLPSSIKYDSYNINCNLWNESVRLETGELLFKSNNDANPTYELIYTEEEIHSTEVICINKIRVNKTLDEKRQELQSWEEETMDLILNNEIKRKEIETVVLTEDSNVVLTLKR